jgi:hypothetical protein
LGLKKLRIRFFLERESVEFMPWVVKGVEDAVVSDGTVESAATATAASVGLLSSGCRSGRGAMGLLLLPSSASLSLASPPISPIFRGRGPACDRESGAVVEEEAVLDDDSMRKIRVGLVAE